MIRLSIIIFCSISSTLVAMEKINALSEQLQNMANKDHISLQAVEFLLDKGADIYYPPITANHKTVISVALNNTKLWKLLVKCAHTFPNKILLLKHAVPEEHIKKIVYLIQYHKELFDTIDVTNNPDLKELFIQLFFIAAKKSNFDFLDYLLSTKKVTINCTNEQGNTLLLEAIKERNKELLIFVVERKAELNSITPTGSTPLQEAMKKFPSDIIQLLLSHGALPTMINASKTTPLMVAAQFNGSKIINLLLNHGARATIDAQDNRGQTALMKACRRGELINKILANILLNAGANPLIQSNEKKLAEQYATDSELKALLSKATEAYEERLVQEIMSND